jgi:hypothetical protein
MDDIGAIQLAVKVDYKELTGLMKTTGQTKRAVRLLAKDFARTGDKSQYMSSINKIVMAQNNLSKTSRMSQSAIMKLGAKVQQETKFTDSLTAATQRLNAAQMASGKVMGNTRNKMNGNNMAIQQLGYQFGDFAVQVQGGTSAFVAFSQQGSQLAGILPMIAGPLGLSMGAAVGLSAALGILIPIVSAAGRMFMEMNTSAKEAANRIKNFEENLKSAKAETFDMVEALRLLKSGFETKAELALSDNIIKAKDHLKAMLVAQENINNAQFESDANRQTSLDIAKKDVDQAREKLKLAREDFNLHKKASASLEKEKDRQKRNESIVNQLVVARRIILEQEQKAIKDKAEAEKTLNLSIVQNRIDGVNAYYAYEEKMAREKAARDKRVAEIQEKERKRLVELGVKASGTQGRGGAIAPSETDVALMGMGGVKADVQELAKAQKILDKINKDLDRSAQIQSKKNQLLEIELRYGKESTTYKYTQKELSDLEFQISQDILKEKLTAQGVDQNAIILAMALNAEEHELLERRKKISQISYGLMEGSDAAQRLGKYGGRGTTSDRDPTMGGVSIYDEPKKTQAQEDADALAEYITQLNHEKKVETELVGIFGSERDIKQKILDIQHEYDGIITPSQVKQIENTLKLTDAETKRHEALQKAKEEQEALGASIEASMEKAFMSMVDGTASVKDAFKTMASEIIKELYRVLVVKKMVSAVTGFFAADGAVLSSGSPVQAYADGGVVGSPTTFPMSGGRTGLMGEAGPEAIMPLKRGANGKLGVQMEGGGATTVVQNFNFSANGDDSVKKIIAQAAPKIAQMTKSEIINDRRRGGTMKATFG